MSKPTNEGTYILKIDGHAVSLTGKSELPQFVFQGSLVRIYDTTEDTWCDWTEYDQEVRGYMCLVSKDKKNTLNRDQVMKATGWDGESYAALSSMNLDGVEVLVRIEEDIYENKTSFKINWIDHKDANPTSTLSKLDDKALAAMDKKFGGGKKVAPASKPKGTRNSRPKPQTQQPVSQPLPAPVTQPETTPVTEPGPTGPAETPVAQTTPDSEGDTTGAAPTNQTVSTGPPAKVSTTSDKHVCADKAQAWQAVQSLKSDKCTDTQLLEAWGKAVQDTGNGDEDTFAAKEWTEVFHLVTSAVGLF